MPVRQYKTTLNGEGDDDEDDKFNSAVYGIEMITEFILRTCSLFH